MTGYPGYLITACRNINRRCNDPRDKSYGRYGAVGIRTFWLNDRDGFINYVLTHLGERPSENHSLDRINNTKGYEPGNIRWATMAEQTRNKRNNKWYTSGGETKCSADLAKEIGLTPSAMTLRRRRGDYSDSPRKGIGETCHLSKLTEEQVIHVIRLVNDGLTQGRVAEIVGTTGSNVSAIVTGKSWKCLHHLLEVKTKAHNFSKLSAQDYSDIVARYESGEELRAIQKDYPVSLEHISKIARGKFKAK